MAQYDWTGAGDGTSWSDPNNWQTDGQVSQSAPGAGDDVNFGIAGPTIVDAESARDVTVFSALGVDAGAVTTSQYFYVDGGDVSISDGGRITVSNLSGATAYLTVDGSIEVKGSDSALDGSGSGGAVIGGVGSLTIEAGASADFKTADLTGSSLSIGDGADANALVLVEGGGSTLTASNVVVGSADDGGTASLTIKAGASANFSAPSPAASSLTIGAVAVANNSVIVAGAGSILTATGVVVGDAGGSGALTVQAGGAADFSNVDNSYAALAIGRQGGAGTVTVDGLGSLLTVTKSSAWVGDSSGVGSLTIQDGATATFTSDPGVAALDIGSHAGGGTGTVIVTGEDSILTASGGAVIVGDSAMGSLTVSAGATLQSDYATYSLDIGEGADGSGAVDVTGAGSTLSAAGTIIVGDAGIGGLTLENGASFQSSVTAEPSINLGDQATGVGTMTVKAIGTNLVMDQGEGVFVGDAGSGTFNVETGATVHVATTDPADFFATVLGYDTTGVGALVVHGLGSTFTAGIGGLSVGDAGSGTVTVAAAGTLDIADTTVGLDIGTLADATGTVNVTGSGSTLDAQGPIVVGDHGTGVLTVEKDGALTADDDISVGAQSTGMGTFTVETGGTADISGALHIGQAPTGGGAGGPFGTGEATVDGSGVTLTADDVVVGGLAPDPSHKNNGQNGEWTYTGGAGTLEVDDDASVVIGRSLKLQDKAETGDSGSLSGAGGMRITSGGGVEVGGGAAAPADTLQVGENGRLTGHGQITGAVTGDTPVAGATTAPTYSLNINNQGTIEADDGTLILDGDASGAGRYWVGDDSTLEFGGKVDGDVTVTFLPGDDETIAIDDPADFKGAISSENWTAGDKIDLLNVSYVNSGSSDADPDGASLLKTGQDQQNDVLQVVEDHQTYDVSINKDDVDFSGGFTLNDDGFGGTLVTYSDDAATACYVRGTRIATPRGYVAIEDLRERDLALTADGAARPIRWIGRRRLDISRHPRPGDVRPVRVASGAFGDGLPLRDLWLSPGHNIAWDGALIPISALINGVSVQQMERDSVEYWHVELDAHDVLLAEGLPAESYLDTGNRTAFANGGAFVEAHPDFKPRHWAETCLPLVTEGPAVVATKAQLLARLFERGYSLDRDADAHVVVDGRRVEPIRLSETRLAFLLPAEGRSIALRSKAFVPAQLDADNSDWRELGLAVGRLWIDGKMFLLDRDEACASGWHPPEFQRGRFKRRWTRVAAPLPPGARSALIELADFGQYWREPPVFRTPRSRHGHNGR